MHPTCLCGHDRYKTHKYNAQDNNFSIIVCSYCGLARTWPRPLAVSNEGPYYSNKEDYLGRYKEYNHWLGLAKRSLILLRKSIASGKLLDVGCNIGIFVKQARVLGFDAFGIDISSTAVKFGQKKLSLSPFLKIGDISSSGVSEESYDIITYIHTLEHIEDLTKELASVRRFLRPGGILLVEAPNFNSIWRRVARNKWYGYAPEEHIWQLSPKPLRRIIENNGFKVIMINSRHCLDHDYSFNLSGAVKRGLQIFSYIFQSGDNFVLLAEKASRI